MPAALPKSAHPAAITAMQQIYNAENGDLARVAAKASPSTTAPSSPRPSPRSSTVRHRTKVTKGPESRMAGLAMAFKLIEAAERRWRAVNAPQLVALVRAGATFHHGKLVERPANDSETQVAQKIFIHKF